MIDVVDKIYSLEHLSGKTNAEYNNILTFILKQTPKPATGDASVFLVPDKGEGLCQEVRPK